MERKLGNQPKEMQSCEPDIPTGVKLALSDSKIQYNERAAVYIVSCLTIKLGQAQGILGLPWDKMRCEEAYAALQQAANPEKFDSGHEEIEVFKDITYFAASIQGVELPKRAIENLFKNAVRYLAEGNKTRKIINGVDASKNFMTRPPGKGRQRFSIARKENSR